jgi:lipoprotein-anchoring transpeptidase ErfK/SrfK
MTRRSKALLAAAVAVPMVLGGAGTAYAAHYQDRALPGSSVAGVSVSGMTRDEVAAEVRERADAVTVTVDVEGAQRGEHLADLGYTVDVDATVDAVFAPNGSWSSMATSLVHPRDVDAVVHVDEQRVDAVVEQVVGDAGKVGRNAAVRLADDKKGFEVVPAVVGQTVDPTSLQDVAEQAARELTSTTATVDFVDTDPAITNAAAEDVADRANALVARKVVVSDGSEDHKASRAEKASWVTVPRSGGVLGTPTVDAKKVAAWVEEVAGSVAVEPTDGLRNVDSTGAVLSVVTQAADGRTAANADALTRAAVKALTAGKGYTGSFEYDTVAASWTDRTVAKGAEKLAYPAAEGEKWVDVNLTKHTMTAYVGATPRIGPVSMVSGGDDFPTVTGTYHVYLKYEKMDMRGTNADGTKYLTEDVPWVSFFYQGIALHGAYWRDSFGYNGSHGCVNLPVDVAKAVYDFAPIGTPVVSHY